MNEMAHGAELPKQNIVHIDLIIEDPQLVLELISYSEGPERNAFALTALRIGILALKQAQGRIDADVVKNEGEKLLLGVEEKLRHHQQSVQEQVAATLKEYFDPNSGRFNERVEQFVKDGGDIARVISKHIGEQDSELARTLAAHVGTNSPLMKALSPSETQGILASITAAVNGSLGEQRDTILKEFSLDRSDSALSRMVSEMKQKHGELSNGLTEKVNEVVAEFSLDKPDSALSRLVGRVETAQNKISAEFSLDESGSALARMKKSLEDLLQKFANENTEFRARVLESLAAIQARREESLKSTRHGLEFEQAVLQFVTGNGQAAGDVVDPTGNTTGLIRSSKVGDAVLTLGPEKSAAGARIVVEAKQDASYTVGKALEEIEVARKNRDAKVGIFVFSKRTAPADIAPLARYGNDIAVTWDAEDLGTDVILVAALSLARALCVREEAEKQGLTIDLERLQKTILEVERQASGLDEIRTGVGTIRAAAQRIDDRARIMGDQLALATGALNEETGHIKVYLQRNGASE